MSGRALLAALLLSTSGCLSSGVRNLHAGVAREEWASFEARTGAVVLDGVPIALDARSVHTPAGVWFLRGGEPFERRADESLGCEGEWLEGPKCGECSAPLLAGDEVLASYRGDRPEALVHELHVVRTRDGAAFLVRGTRWERFAARRFRFRGHQPEREALWTIPFAPLYVVAAAADVLASPFQLGAALAARVGNMSRD